MSDNSTTNNSEVDKVSGIGQNGDPAVNTTSNGTSSDTEDTGTNVNSVSGIDDYLPQVDPPAIKFPTTSTNTLDSGTASSSFDFSNFGTQSDSNYSTVNQEADNALGRSDNSYNTDYLDGLNDFYTSNKSVVAADENTPGESSGYNQGGMPKQDPLYESGWIDSNVGDELLRLATQSAHLGAGKGAYDTRYVNALAQYDWLGQGSPQITNHELQGMTFITRPTLNLQDGNIGQDSRMSMLKNVTANSFGFSIRSYLDPFFSEMASVKPLALKCDIYNHESPFLIPLQNQLTHISGWPSFDLHTEASEAGFMSESQIISRGSDFNNQPVDLTLGFQDIQGGYIMAMLEYWTRAIALMNAGYMMPYMQDIVESRLCYTCSIYRFVLDPTKTFITKWAKATGCFPTSVPIGTCFDIEGPEQYIHASNNFSIRFAANHIEYNDPDIFQDFNRLIITQNPDLSSQRRIQMAPISENNFKGLPFIQAYDGSNRLLRLATEDEVNNDFQKAIDTLKKVADNQIAQKVNTLNKYYFGSDSNDVITPQGRLNQAYEDYMKSGKITTAAELGNMIYPASNWAYDPM